MEVRNRFKGLDLIQCLMNHGQRFVTLYRSCDIIQETGSKTIPKKKKCKLSKMAV